MPILPPLLGATKFTLLDWGVVVAYFIFTTAVGARLAGKQATIRDFFLGGRRLPWYAVAGSIVATELSAVTFVSVPFVVFNYLLTSTVIVHYSPEAIWGVRVTTIPLEDFFYNFSMLSFYLAAYIHFRARWVKDAGGPGSGKGGA